jgi:acyl-CoA synthetase (AMP-forming)/AMP-acid ligase II
MTWLDELTAIGRLVGSARRALPNSNWTMTRLLEQRASQSPDDLAVAYLDRRYTWGEIDQYANRWAHVFKGEGIQPGDIVALIMDNRPEYLFAVHGLAKIGAAAALINTNLTGQPLAHAITVGNSRKVVAGDEHAATVEEVIAELKTLDDERPVLLQVEDATQPRPGGGVPLNEAVQSAPTSKPQVAFDADSEALFCYIYTSGTTGLPKAAVISHRRAMIGGVGAAHVMMRLKPGDVSYVALPLYHSSAMFIGWSAVLNSGAAMALRRKFSVTHFWDDVRRFGATHSVYIGELCRYLLNGEPGPGDRDHNLRCVMGNGLRPDIWHEFQERFGIPEIREFYGATEGTAGLMNRTGKPGMVGKIGLGMKLVTCDQETGEPIRGADGFCTPVEPGEIGLLLGPISKATSFDGYVEREASQKKIMTDVFKTGDRFFNTGDLLQLHEGKWLSFADRVGDTFRWKGENVSTNEVAEVCNGAPGVLETNVYGVQVPGADGRAGMAAVNTEEDFDLAAFAGFVKSALPGYQRPLFVRLLGGQMQTTGTFKHQKVRYRNEAFDPGQCEDPLYYFDGESYQPIDAAVFGAIVSGVTRVG